MPRGDAFFDSLTFRDDDKVEVGLIGVTHIGSYEIEDGVVAITGADGTVSRMNIDANGCLSHEIAGVYCKGSSNPAASGGSPAAGGAGASGAASAGGPERFEATLAEGRIGLELLPAGTARLTMMSPEPGGNMTLEIGYERSGNDILLRMPGEPEPLRFTRTGRDLVATMDGETARFVRQ